MGFMTVSQRSRDIGLMRAAACPNDLVFGYFMTQVLVVTALSCFSGIILGTLADFASTLLLGGLGFQISQKPINLWLILLVFVIFFVLAIIFGAKPIFDATKVAPAKALSPVYYFGLSNESGFKVASKSGFTLKIALRGLFRHKSATTRIILCLAAVFLLATVGIAGGLIANQTTENWIAQAIGRDTVLIAHKDLCSQYKLLQSKFYEPKENPAINYTDSRYLIPNDTLAQIALMPNITNIDPRLILETQVKEIQSYIIDPETLATIEVGDSRKDTSLIVGVEAEKVLSKWFLEGEFLKKNREWEAVVGDSLARKIFSSPLDQRIELLNMTFDVVGVCLDPINNGYVTYVPLKNLQNITAVSSPNIVIAELSPSTNRSHLLDQLRTQINMLEPDFDILDLNEMLDKDLTFTSYMWSAIMLLPLSSLFAASICLMSYVSLSIAEQRQEFGILRALGAKPNAIVKIISQQSLIAVLSGFAFGVAFGIITTLMILIPEPLVTTYTIIEVAAWMLLALALIFLFSLYPALKFAKKPILEIMAQ
jgi:ABC-type antimicrobial peptide transport system permease subunit